MPKTRLLVRLALSMLATTLALSAPLTTATATTAGPGDYPVHGVDTSGHQHPGNKPINWGQVSRSGQKFAIVKATQGSRSVSPWFARDLAGARSVKLIHTAYHYFEHGQGGAAQAEHFLKTVQQQNLNGTRPYQLPLVLDVERQEKGKPACGAGPGALTSRVLDFLNTVEKKTGVSPTLYSQKSFVNQCMGGTKALGKYRAWLAHYSPTPPPPLPGGTGWSFWQYTEKATVPGIPKETDANVFRGSYAGLKRLANLG
ncbi:glycoside hydrolase family 25 protein [Streptomyces sp. NPDC024017]|uniref:glycoside hydrolase family 25 protein n=1 Tax=Streptomyces sp. NPDC024017 TaxID=3154326 RepID=UPI00340E4D4B